MDNSDSDSIVVLIGTPTADSSRLYALTVTEGDPAWAGLWPAYLSIVGMVIERQQISKAMNEVRSGREDF